MADGSIEFSVELDAKDAEKTLASVKKKIMQLEAELHVKEGRRSELDAALENASTAADAARQKLKDLRAEQERLNSIVNPKLDGNLPDVSYDEFMRAKPRLEELKKEIKEQEAYEKQLTKDAETAWAEMSKYNAEVEKLNDKLAAQKGLYGELAREVREAPTVPEEKPTPGGSGETPERASRAGLELVKRSGNFAAQWKRVHSYLANSVKRLSIFSALTARTGGLLKRILSLAGGAFIFSQISSGFRSMRSSMEEMLQTNTNLMMALTRFKGALKAAFLPIYEVAVPALTALLNLLTRVMYTVAAFTAALTGKTAQEVKATAAALQDEADATEGVGKAAKDANKPLASFDEINKLDSKDTGGGAGADAGAAADLELPEVEIKSWGEMLDSFFDKLLGKLPQVEDAFTKFADKLNGFAKKLLEAFTFPGLEEKVRALGRGLAEAFNKLVDQIDWYTLGAALGAGLNLALGFLVEFIYGFDWVALGSALADSFNGLVSQINWYDFGRLLWSGFKIALETLAGFLIGLDMPQLAQAASNIAKGFFDSITQTLRTIDWQEIGRQVARFLKNVDWVGVLSSVWEAVKSAIKAGFELISGFLQEMGPKAIFAGIAILFAILVGKIIAGIASLAITIAGKIALTSLLAPIVTSLSNIIAGIISILAGWPGIIIAALAIGITALVIWLENGGKDVVAGWFKGMGEALSNLGAWIKEHIVDPFLNFFKNLFGIASPSTVMYEMGVYIIEGLLNGIIETWTRIAAFFTQALANLRQWFADTWAQIRESAMTAWTDIRERLTEIWNALRQTATTVWTAVKTFFQQTWDAIKQSTTNTWNNIKTTLTATWSMLKQLATETWNSLKQTISAAWDEVKTGTTTVWSTIKSTLTSTWSSIKTTAVSAFNGLKTGVLSAWQSLWSGIKGILNSMLGGVESWINGIIRSINELISGMDLLNKVASWAGEKLGLGSVNLSLSEVRLPRLAQGAVIPPNREFLAVLGDQQSGTNIETPLSTMVEAFRQALGESGGGQKVVVLKIGEREMGRMVVDLFNQESARVGVSV